MSWHLRQLNGDLLVTDPEGVTHDIGRIKGEDATPSMDQVIRACSLWLTRYRPIWKPKNGANASDKQVKRAVSAWCSEHVAELRGENGKSVTDGQIEAAAAHWLTTHLERWRPKNGRAPTSDEISKAAQAWLEANRESLIGPACEEPGPAGPAPAHRWKGTRLQFQNPDGTWGIERDLEGSVKSTKGTAFAGGLTRPEVLALIQQEGSDMDALAKYRISDIDKTPALVNYYGFLEPAGKWYVMREDKSDPTIATYRYANGASDYATNWGNREGLTYQRLEALTDL